MSLTSNQEKFLVKAAKWIKSTGNKYCPITAVSKMGGWKSTFNELASLELVVKYKSGKVIKITEDGWAFLARHHPEIARRRTGKIRLE